MLHEDNRWIAVYTRARSERSLAHYLQQRGLTSYVPLQRRRHKWSDRLKWVEEPLLPSYVFVFLSPVQYDRLYDAPGAVRIITFRGRTAVVRQEEIDLLRRSEHNPECVAVGLDRPKVGTPVRITGGMFEGYSGTVVRFGDCYTIALAIGELEYSLHVTVPRADVEVV